MRYDAKSGITIMLVDSNEKFLQHFLQFLKSKLPYNFIVEKNGTQAIVTAEKTPVQLFLMEAKLSKQVSGFETLELIKSNDKLKNTPVIFVSSLRDPESFNKAKALGVDAYLHKPIDKRKVFDYVVGYIKKTVKFKILYVDSDSKLFPRVENIAKHLLPYPVEVVTADSAMDAMAIIDTQEINLLICGNDMPVVTGVRMLEMLRDQNKLDDLGVIFLPSDDLSTTERYSLAGLEIEHYAEKPFKDANEFIDTIMAALNVTAIPAYNDFVLE